MDDTDATEARELRIREAGEQFLALTESLGSDDLSLTDLLLAMDMRGWVAAGEAFGSHRDLTMPERRAYVHRSRVMAARRPLAQLQVGVYTTYCFETPWTVQARDPALQEVIDATFMAAANRRTYSLKGMQRSSNNLLIDGERFYLYFPDEAAGYTRVRHLDPLQIVAVLTNPEDDDEPWYYLRAWAGADGKQRAMVYRDWNFVDEDGQPRSDPHPWLSDSARLQGWGIPVGSNLVPEDGVWATYLAINDQGMRGMPLLAASLDWIEAHEGFVRDRSTINGARAKIAAKVTVPGGQKNVDAVRAAFTASGAPGNADAPAGQTAVFGKGMEYDMPTPPSDGGSAANDHRAIRLLALGASRTPEHLTGDLQTGNLATAQAASRPLEKMLSSYQGMWMDHRRDEVAHLALWHGFEGDLTVDIDGPAIVERSVLELLQGLQSAATVFPAIGQSSEVLALVLTELGLNNVEDVVAAIEPLLGEEPEPAAVKEALRVMEEARRAR